MRTQRPGRSGAKVHTLDWVVEAQRLGAGEIVLNCMDSDGVRRGYTSGQLRAVRALCSVPLVASGRRRGGAFQRCSARPTWTAPSPRASSGGKCGSELKRSCAGAGWRCDDGSDRGVEAIDWDKAGGLVPAVVQDARTLRVLMLGMDRARRGRCRAG